MNSILTYGTCRKTPWYRYQLPYHSLLSTWRMMHSLPISWHTNSGKESKGQTKKEWRKSSKWPQISLQPCTSHIMPVTRKQSPFQDTSFSNDNLLNQKNGPQSKLPKSSQRFKDKRRQPNKSLLHQTELPNSAC